MSKTPKPMSLNSSNNEQDETMQTPTKNGANIPPPLKRTYPEIKQDGINILYGMDDILKDDDSSDDDTIDDDTIDDDSTKETKESIENADLVDDVDDGVFPTNYVIPRLRKKRPKANPIVS